MRRPEFVLVRTLILLSIGLNILPFLRRLYTTPPDKVFLGTQFYTVDYNIYLGHFKEGAEGIFRIHDKHTPEPHSGFFLRREYWLWGFITGYLLKLPIWAVYHSARITAGITLLFLIYSLIKKVFSSPAIRIFCFFLITFIAGFPKLLIDPRTGGKSIDLYLNWFLEFDPANRFATLFHYLVGNILLLLFISRFPSLIAKKIAFKDKRWLADLAILVLIGIFAGLSHPSTLATLYLMLPVYIFLKFLTIISQKFVPLRIRNPQKKFANNQESGLAILQKETFVAAAFVLLSSPIILFVRSQTNTFPWTEIAKWDMTTPVLINPREFRLSLGPNYYLGIAGAILTLTSLLFLSKKAKPVISSGAKDSLSWEDLPQTHTILLLLVSFLISSHLWIFKLFPLVPQINRLRFMQVPVYVPLGLFSAILIGKTATLLSRLVPKFQRQTKTSLIAAGALTLFTITFPSYHWGVKREYQMFPPGDYLMYTDKNLYSAYRWLDKNTHPAEVVLASFYSATLIPGQSGNTSYWGHPWSTVDFNTKALGVEKFFTNQMSPDQAYTFLKQGNIAYVLDDFQSRSYAGDLSNYSAFLSPVFANPDATILKFNP